MWLLFSVMVRVGYRCIDINEDFVYPTALPLRFAVLRDHAVRVRCGGVTPTLY
jgi:hypothetical protein